MITYVGVYPLLHPNCHHQITFAKINFNVYIPPLYMRHILHYDRANVTEIRKAIDLFDWTNAFCNLDVNKQVEYFNSTFINVFKN